jgi:uncharacterized protein (TIGR03437 family)
MFAVGVGGISARLKSASEESELRPTAVVASPARSAHFVTPSNAVGLDIISSTPVTSVSAASLEVAPIAPGSIVTGFGAQLATREESATDADPNTPGVQLPTQLAGTTVEVNGRRAGLFFVAPGQINYVMPDATQIGNANIVVRSGAGTISNGTAQIAQVAPSIFTANSNGKGVAAAVLLRVKTNGQQAYESLSEFNSQVGRFVTRPIDLGPEGELVFLVLYLTGVRGANGPGSVRVLLGGNEITPVSVGGAPDFVGLDQVNVPIPRALIGRGVVNVSVTAAGFTTSNLVDIEIAGPQGPTPPRVTGFGGTAALAGQPMDIMGSGFAANKDDNTVRIAGLEAEVMSATPTKLTVMIPFSVEAGTVRVITPTGEGVSTNVLPVRTSISGLVENTAQQPLADVAVKVTGTNITATTNAEGTFVLPDVPAAPHFVEVDGGSIGVNPPYPRVILKVTAHTNRDNQIARAIALQQATGSGGTVGSGTSLTAEGAGVETGGANQAQPQPQPVSIQTDDFKLELPGSTKVTFPSGATRGAIFLTPLQNARTPVELPFGFYSSSIVQITPFNVSLDPGAKLTLPNKDGFPAGSRVALFRYDQEVGKFVQEAATAQVSTDGQRIETAADAIKTTSYYFAAPSRDTTTIVGRVLETDRRTPVNRALVRFRGQEAYTDGNGSYTLRYIPVRSGESVSIEVSVVRPSGRVDRVQSAGVPPVLGGTTRVPDVSMPATTENRPPTIIAPPRIEAEEGKTTDVRFNVSDPDGNTIRDVRVEGASFASVVRGGTTTATAYSLRLAPNFSHSGGYVLTIRAEDSAGGLGRSLVSLFVKDVNRAPTAANQPVTLDEDTTTPIRLEGSDPDGDRLAFTVVSQPLSGALTGSAQNLTYKPNLNFNGVDRFTFKVNDGVVDSNVATVTITVRPVNDPPILTAPAAQTVNEGQLLSFAVSASDPDVGQRLTIATTGMPTGATLTQASATSWQFRWTPTFAQAGNYSIGFRVTDDGQPPLSDAKETRIVVSDVALFTAPGAKIGAEGQALVFDVSANDGLPAPVVITATNLPDGATFPGSATNTGQFRWTPSFTQAGSYVVSFKATISDLPPVSETAQVTITVLDVERNLAEEPASFTVLGPTDTSEQQPGSNAGSSVAVGDVNGDGLADLVIGAPSGMAPTNGATGSVHIFFGRATLGGTVDLARQPADVNISGEAAGDLFGSSLAIGDLNGDGKPDLIIGSPGADPTPNAPDGGKIYAVFGDLAPGTPKIAEVANLTILGAARGDRLGSSLTVGKINSATGADDLVAGAPFADIPAGADSLVDAGRVYGFWGAALLAGVKDLANSSADFTITGVVANGHLGATLGAGNFNNGDLADIAVGAPNADNGLLKDAGAVYLVLGSQALKGSFSATQLAALTINGADAGDAAGSSLAMGDLNSDGRADVIIGSPGADGPNNDRPGAGEVHVVFGMAIVQGRPPILTIFGDSANADDFPDSFGSEVAMGDFTGDGIADLIVGAPGADPVSQTRQPTGAAYVIFGGIGLATGVFDLMNRTVDLKIFGAKSGDRLGSGGLAVGNVSGAAPGDLAIGAPAAAKGASGAGGAGEVRVLYGVNR